MPVGRDRQRASGRGEAREQEQGQARAAEEAHHQLVEHVDFLPVTKS
jgi:hypothetical protein